jgi:hypothetical protein
LAHIGGKKEGVDGVGKLFAQAGPPPHSVKYFAASELLEQVEDRAWLAKVTNALNQHWQRRNAAKKNRCAIDSQNGRVTANRGGSNGRDNSSIAGH